MSASQVPADRQVTMYTAGWCSDCWRAKRFLKSNNIDRDEQAARLVMQVNEGRRRVPTFAIAGAYHGNPPLSELARLLGVG